MVLLLFLGYVYLPEGKVVQYRVEDYSNRYGSGQRIRVVLDNEMDEYIDIPNLSLKEAFMLCDSLNKKIN